MAYKPIGLVGHAVRDALAERCEASLWDGERWVVEAKWCQNEGLELRWVASVATSGPTPLFAIVSGAPLYSFPTPDGGTRLFQPRRPVTPEVREAIRRAAQLALAQPSSPWRSAIARRSRSSRMARPSWSAPARKRS